MTDPIRPEQQSALASVLAERMRQDSKWGEQNHDPQTYLCILGEEYGEACQAANDARWPLITRNESLPQLRAELVQTAAVALAAIECLDRGKWKWPET